MGVAAKVYRLLQHAAREYTRAQIPLVGIVGFESTPSLVVPSLLASLFRQPVLPGEAGHHTSEAFRALRQIQHQLEVLRGSEDDTRDALASWHQLGKAWSTSHVAAPAQALLPGSTALATPPSTRQAAAAAAGGLPSEQEAPSGLAANPHLHQQQLQQLCAALEDGSLLVDRLWAACRTDPLLDDDVDEDDGAGGMTQQQPQQQAGQVGSSWHPEGDGPTDAQGALQWGGGASRTRDLLPVLAVREVAAVRRQLDELAAEVAAGSRPRLFAVGTAFGEGGTSSSGAPSPPDQPLEAVREAKALLQEQLAAISQVLFHAPGEGRFRNDPVEWVYDGLGPALLPPLLRHRRGVPLSLAVLYCCVAARLGLGVRPVRAASGQEQGGGSVAEGPATLHGLPPEVAARQAGRTAALAPPQDTWLVAAVPPPPAPHASSDQLQETGRQAGLSAWRGHEELLLVDVGRKGAVLSVEQARAKYRDMLPDSALGRCPTAPELWGELVRVVLTAHMRRGESDLVAHWLVQLLALDHRAPEWQAVMAGRA